MKEKTVKRAKIDNTQRNIKCRLYGDWDQTVNHIISEYSKLAQKEYKTRHKWMGKMIHWELCKKLKLDQMSYAQNSISPREWHP